jgi:PAS domain S-box-containing protein
MSRWSPEASAVIEAPVLKRIQVTFLAGALAFFSWGWVLQFAVPEAWDSWPLRVGVSVLCLLSYVVSTHIPSQKRFVVPLFNSMLLICAFFLWIQLYMNHFDPFYSAVFTVASSALSVVALSFRSAVYLASLQSFLVLLAPWVGGHRDLQSYAFSFVTLCSLWLPALLQYSTEKALRALWSAGRGVSQIVNSLQEGLLLQDRRGKIVYFNERAPSILGVDAEQLLEKAALDSSWKIVTEDGQPLGETDHPAMLTLRTGRSQLNVVLGIHRPDGEFRWIRVSSHAVKDMYVIALSRSGDSLEDGVLLAFEDITEEKARDEALIRTRAAMVDTARLSSLGEAAAGIAHEINNPLSVVNLKLETLLEELETGAQSPTLLADLKQVHICAQRITKLVKSVRGLSRDSSHDPKLPKNLQEMVGEVLSVYSERLRHVGIEARVKVDPQLSLLCRPSQIGQVLTNLVQNSIDAILEARESKGKTVPVSPDWIELRGCALPDGGLELVFEDSGPGIPEIIRKRVMEPFFTTKPQGKGTGLGLSISHSIIQGHLGRFEIEGCGRGARFKMVFPSTVVDRGVLAA